MKGVYNRGTVFQKCIGCSCHLWYYWPYPLEAMKCLKAAGAVAAEVIVGQRRVIKPSWKSKAAAGRHSGEDDQTSDPEDTEEIGGKHKKSATTKA